MQKRFIAYLLIAFLFSITILTQPVHAQSETEHGIKQCLICQFLSESSIIPDTVISYEVSQADTICEITASVIVSKQIHATIAARAPPIGQRA